MNRSNMFWQVYLNLEKEVLELSRFILFTDTTLKVDKKTNVVKTVDNKQHLEVYSPFIADLLVRCCVEIEALSKELYFDNGGTKVRGSKDIYFDTDCLGLLNQKWNLDNKKVVISASNFSFTKEENQILTPLKQANERSKVYWAKSYQAVKHDRYNSLHQGTIKAVLQAMGALFLLNIYYKDISMSTKYSEYKKLDMSFGSKIFTLPLPNDNYVIDVVNGKRISELLHSTDSPYILKYTDKEYKNTIDAREKALKEQSEYLNAQPELTDPLFIKEIEDGLDKQRVNPQERFVILTALHKFRLNKKIPSTLPFEERKKLFINSAEWNGQIRQLNNPKSEIEITEENIQSEIDRAATLAGFELAKHFERAIFKAISDGRCEMVLDKGNVKYES